MSTDCEAGGFARPARAMRATPCHMQQLKAAAHSRSAPVHADVPESLEIGRDAAAPSPSCFHCYLMGFVFCRSSPSALSTLTCPVELTEAAIAGSYRRRPCTIPEP